MCFGAWYARVIYNARLGMCPVRYLVRIEQLFRSSAQARANADFGTKTAGNQLAGERQELRAFFKRPSKSLIGNRSEGSSVSDIRMGSTIGGSSSSRASTYLQPL